MKLKNLLTISMAVVAIGASAQGFKDGIEYYRAGQVRNARTILERNVNNPETDKAEANYYLGAIAFQYSDNAKAKKYFEAGIAANPAYPLNYVGLGEMALENKDVKEAEKQFKLAEKFAGKQDAASTRIAIARAYYNVDPVTYASKIAKYVEQARKKDMKEPDIYLFEGDMEADKHNYGEAGGKYEMAISYHPDTAEGYVKYAKLFDQVNPAYSIAKLEELLRVMPQSALGQRELALAYYNQQMYDKAAEQYGKYVKNPNHFREDEDQYALLLFFNSEYQKGYDFATDLLKVNPKNFTAQRFQFINAAQLPAMSENMLSLAEDLYAKHKADENNTLAPIDYSLMSKLFTNAQQYDKVEDLLNEAIKVYPNDPSYLDKLTDLYLAQQQYDKAADTFALFVEKQANPRYGDIVTLARYYMYGASDLNKAGEADKAQKYYDNAIVAIDKAIELFPDEYRAYQVKGDIILDRSNNSADGTAAAIENYKKSADCMASITEPNQSEINNARKVLGYLGSYYYNKGDYSNSNKYFKQYLSLDPSDTAGYGKYIK